LRLEAEEQYQRALTRVAQKFLLQGATPRSDCYGLLLGEMSRIHSERSFQVSYFREQMAADVVQLRTISKNISAELDNRLKDFRRIEKDLKLNGEKVEKGRFRAIQCHRELDERIILN